MMSRRDVLRRALGAVALAPASAAGGAPAIDTEPAIPVPFDAIPTLDTPGEVVRKTARSVFPPEAVPTTGTIPDPMHRHVESAEVTVPEWAMHATRWRLGHDDPDALDRWRVREFLSEYARPKARYRTPDGCDAVGVLLEEADDADV